MLTLEEVERLALDLFLVERSTVIDVILGRVITDTAGVKIANMYNEYIHKMQSEDNRKLYMFGFIIIASKFRNYWIELGDRVTMEHIQNQWIRVECI